MREILFRGKRLDNGEWVEGYMVKRPSAIQIGDYSPWYIYVPPVDPDDNGSCHNVDPATIGQYTGLRDKNGNRVFEGDLCLCDRHINDSFDKTVFEIMFDPLRGYYGESSWGSEFDGTSFELCEVIGNIHDTPELLKEDSDE